MKCEDCPNAEWDCVDGHWYIYGCMGECEEDEAIESEDVICIYRDVEAEDEA